MSRKYDGTVARIAGNLLAGVITGPLYQVTTVQAIQLAQSAVKIARAIVDEVIRTEPAQELRDAADGR